MTTMQELASEALCSALYNLPFSRFLGERPDEHDGRDVAWFRLSRDPEVEQSARSDPKQVMVAVRKVEAELVVVQVSWLNISRGLDHPMRGEQVFRVGTNGSQPDVMAATEQAVLAVLSIFDDVVTGRGVAGPIEQLAPPSEAGDPDDPEDMAVPLSE